MERKTKGLILVLIALVAFTAPAAAQNASDVQSQLQVAQEAIQQMENEGVPTERAQSLLTTANNSYKAQQSLEGEGGEPDYSRTLELTDQIISMKETALRVNDRLNALENRINELGNNSNLNLTDVKAAYRDVNQTFNDQRFSEAENQVEQVYTEISEAQSVETQVQAFASAQQQNITGLVENAVNYATENWLTLLIGGTVFGGILLIGGRELKLWRLKKKKESLLSEKQIVEKMVEEAQREYFVEGKGSKMSFQTRMDKFKEMLRDTEESLNNVENEIERMEGLPVISPDIKARTEDFKEAGDVITESKEVKGSLDRIREQEEKEKEGAEEKDIEVIEEKKDSGEKASEEEHGEDKDSEREKPVEVKDIEDEEEEKVNEYVTLVNESTVKEAKPRIEEIEKPDYKALMEAEKANKDRVTLERFLEDKIEEQEAEEKEEDNSETETEEKPVEVIEDSEKVSEEENEDSESEKAIEENEDETETLEESESQERPVEVKDTEDNEEQEDEPDEGDEEKIVDKGGKTVEEAGIEYVEADEDEEKDKEQESEEGKASAEETIEEELGKAFASVGNDDEEEDEYEDKSEDLSEEKEVDEKQVSEEEKTTGVSEKYEDYGDQDVSDEKPVEVKDTEEPSEEIVESSKERGSDEKESSEETDEPGEDEEDIDIIEEDGKYIDPETGKEFDTESAAKLFKQHFG